jgi:hypothetical protein
LEWDLSVLDHDFKEDEQWGEVPEMDSSFDEVGDYKHRVIVQHLAYFHRQDGNLIDDVIDQCVLDAQTSQVPHEPVFYDAHETELAIPEGIPPAPTPPGPKIISQRDPDYNQLRPFFGWISPEIIKKIFEHTTQYARLPTGTLLKKAYKSPNPAFNVFHVKRMLLATLYILMSQPSMMIPLLLLSLLALTLKSLMYMALRQINNLLIH